MRTKNSDLAFASLITAAELAQLMGYTGATNAFRTFLFKAGIKPVPGARGKYDPKIVRYRLDEIQGLTERPHSAAAAPLSLVQQRRARNGIVAEVRRRPDTPLSPLGSGHAFDLGSAECIETVHECHADLDFGGLSVRVA